MSDGWSEKQSALCAQAGIGEEVGRWLHGNIGPIERLRGYNDESIRGYDAPGLSVVIEHEALEEHLEAARKYLHPQAHAVFWSPRPDRGPSCDELCVLREGDFFAPVRLRNTDGAEQDVLLEDIIEKLQGWRGLCEFEITGAGLDFVSLLFHTLPEDLCAFACEAYAFCPDVIEQGVGLACEERDPELFELARARPCRATDALRQEKKREWEETRQLLPEEVRALLGEDEPGQSFEEDLDFHISLLATEIERSHTLFLWWE